MGPATDTFRKEYKPLSDEQKIDMAIVKDVAKKLETVILNAKTQGNGREMAVAMTNLETAIMWAVKGITK